VWKKHQITMFETIFLLIHKGIFIIQEGNEIQGNRKRKYINELKTPKDINF
jgi:hypothetical protein